jgi:hypothetical protein
VEEQEDLWRGACGCHLHLAYYLRFWSTTLFCHYNGL